MLSRLRPATEAAAARAVIFAQMVNDPGYQQGGGFKYGVNKEKASQERERLFKPFYTARKPDGTGLGLWVSLSLIERYGGRITVDSEAGRGSRFSVWLRFEPLAQEIGA